MSEPHRAGWSRLAARAVAVLGVAMIAAGCDSAPPASAGADGCVVDAEQAAAAPPAERATVYLDLSSSMSGFLGDATHPMPVTPLQRLLRSLLREGAGRVGIGALGWAGFGREVIDLPAELADYSPSGAGRARRHFTQTETNIVAAFRAAAAAGDELSIVLTDGAQDLLRPDGQTALGFDRGAFVRAVAGDLAGAGFGAWLIGIQSEFSGIYYSVQLSGGPEGAMENRVIGLRGRQPLYLWIFARDLDQGRRLTRFLHAELARNERGAEGEGDGAERVVAIELAPGARPDVVLGNPEREVQDHLRFAAANDPPAPAPGEVSEYRDYLAIREWGQAAQGRYSTTLAFRSARMQQGLVLLKTRLEWPPWSEGWESFPQQAWQVEVPSELPFGARLGGEPSGGDAWRSESHRYGTIQIDQANLATVRPSEWRLEVPVLLRGLPDRIPGNHWLRAWDTEDDTSVEAMAGRTLYLWTVTRGILDEVVAAAKTRACLEVELVRE